MIVNIEDHYAYTCDCGSVHFILLKSENIECAYCGKILEFNWALKRKIGDLDAKEICIQKT